MEIIVRGDSAYRRDDIMSWCKAQVTVEYILAHASNSRLRSLTWGLEQHSDHHLNCPYLFPQACFHPATPRADQPRS